MKVPMKVISKTLSKTLIAMASCSNACSAVVELMCSSYRANSGLQNVNGGRLAERVQSSKRV